MFNKKKSKKKQSLGRVGRVEREHRYNQMIQITTYAVVGLVVIVTIIGIVINTLVIPSRTIVSVDGTEITVRDFQKRAKLERSKLVSLHDQYYSTYQTYQQFAQSMTDANQQQQILSYLQQIQTVMQQIEDQLGPDNQEAFATQVLNTMIDDMFVVQEAKSRGITVTDADIDNYLQTQYGYYPNGYPTPEPTTPPVPTSTLSPTQYALVSPTPEPTQAEDQSAEPTLVPTEAPAPTSITEQEYTDAIQPQLDKVKSYGYSEAEYREYIRVVLYRSKLNADLEAGITPPTEEQVWARHILVTDEATAQDLRDQLDNGADFGDLARENSIDGSAASGGDLGWFSRGMMITEFEDAAFGADVGEIVGPVETQYGFHIIQVLGKEERPAPQSEMDALVQTALDDLLNQYRENAQIDYMEENWTQYTPNKPDVLRVNQTG